jgi:hypothetical protein
MKSILVFIVTVLAITGQLVAQEQQKSNLADKNGGSQSSRDNRIVIPNFNSGRDLRSPDYKKSESLKSRPGFKKASQQKTIFSKEKVIETKNELNQDSLSSPNVRSEYGSHAGENNSSSGSRRKFEKNNSQKSVPGNQLEINLKNDSNQNSSSSTKFYNVDSSNEVKINIDSVEGQNSISLKAGWISNSDKPIIIDSCNSLMLTDNQKNVYIGYLLQLKKDISGFYISCNNNSAVDFTLMEIISTGEKYPPVSFKLPVGNYKDYKIIFQPNSRYSSLLLKFTKEVPGAFILNNIKIMEE